MGFSLFVVCSFVVFRGGLLLLFCLFGLFEMFVIVLCMFGGLFGLLFVCLVCLFCLFVFALDCFCLLFGGAKEKCGSKTTEIHGKYVYVLQRVWSCVFSMKFSTRLRNIL